MANKQFTLIPMNLGFFLCCAIFSSFSHFFVPFFSFLSHSFSIQLTTNFHLRHVPRSFNQAFWKSYSHYHRFTLFLLSDSFSSTTTHPHHGHAFLFPLHLLAPFSFLFSILNAKVCIFILKYENPLFHF